jgi:hypothetical protein
MCLVRRFRRKPEGSVHLERRATGAANNYAVEIRGSNPLGATLSRCLKIQPVKR